MKNSGHIRRHGGTKQTIFQATHDENPCNTPQPVTTFKCAHIPSATKKTAP